MRIHRSGHKHGVADADILHAIDQSLAAIDLDDERTLYLGPDRAANFLEVVVLTCEGEEQELDRLAERTALDLDRLAEQLNRDEAPVVHVRRGRGRPPLGSVAAEPMRLRLEPELRQAVTERAQAEGTNDSEIVRRALRQYLAWPA